MRYSLWQAPWWNADRRARCDQRAAAPEQAWQVTIHVCRRSASCFSFFVAWIERSEIRVFLEALRPFPDCAALHPGYVLGMIVTKPVPPPVKSDEDPAPPVLATPLA